MLFLTLFTYHCLIVVKKSAAGYVNIKKSCEHEDAIYSNICLNILKMLLSQGWEKLQVVFKFPALLKYATLFLGGPPAD